MSPVLTSQGDSCREEVFPFSKLDRVHRLKRPQLHVISTVHMRTSKFPHLKERKIKIHPKSNEVKRVKSSLLQILVETKAIRQFLEFRFTKYVLQWQCWYDPNALAPHQRSAGLNQGSWGFTLFVDTSGLAQIREMLKC